MNYKDNALALSTLGALFVLVPLLALAALLWASVSPESESITFSRSSPINITTDVSCQFFLATGQTNPVDDQINMLVVLGTSQLKVSVDEADPNSVVIARVGRTYRPADLQTVGEECWVLLQASTSATNATAKQFPDIDFTFTSAGNGLQGGSAAKLGGSSLNLISVGAVSLSSVRVVSSGGVHLEMAGATVNGTVDVAASHVHVVAQDVAWVGDGDGTGGTQQGLNVAMHTGSVSVSSPNPANIRLSWPSDDSVTVDDAGGYMCVSGMDVNCTAAAASGECLQYSVASTDANSTADAAGVVADVTVSWLAKSEALSLLQPTEPTPQFRWVASSGVVLDDGRGGYQYYYPSVPEGGETHRNALYPDFGLDKTVMNHVAEATAFGFEYIKVHIASTGTVIESQWVLVSSDDYFATKFTPDVLDMLSVGTLAYRTFTAWTPLSPEVCPIPASSNSSTANYEQQLQLEAEQLVAVVFEQLTLVANGYTVYFQDSEGRLNTYLEPPQSPARELRSQSLLEDPTMLGLMAAVGAAATAFGVYAAMLMSDHLKKVVGNAVFKHYYFSNFKYALREATADDLGDVDSHDGGGGSDGDGAGGGAGGDVYTRRTPSSLLNDAERDANDSGLLVFVTLLCNDNELFGNFVHRHVWRDWQFARPFYWHVGAALRSMRAAPYADVRRCWCCWFASPRATRIFSTNRNALPIPTCVSHVVCIVSGWRFDSSDEELCATAVG